MRQSPIPAQQLTTVSALPPGCGWIGLDQVDEYLGVAPGVGRRLVQDGTLPLHRLPHGDLVVGRRDLDACCVPVPVAEVPGCLAACAAIPQASFHPGVIGVMDLLQRVLKRVEQVLQERPSTTDENPARVPGATVCPDGGLLTVAEVASILRCSTKTVRRMINAGVLPASSRTGRAIRIQASDIQRVLRPKSGDRAAMDAFIARAMK